MAILLDWSLQSDRSLQSGGPPPAGTHSPSDGCAASEVVLHALSISGGGNTGCDAVFKF